MSAAPPQAVIKPLPAPYHEPLHAALAFGQQRDTGILAHSFTPPLDHQTDGLHSDDFSSSLLAQHQDSVPTTPFDFDPQFTFQDLPGEHPGGPLSEDHAPGLASPLLSQSVPFPSLVPDLNHPQAPPTPAASAPNHGLGSAESSRGRSSMEGSDGESPGSYPQLQSLDDPVPDEFGLINKFHNGLGVAAGLGSKPKEDKSDHVPAWSELKTKAGKERKRLPLACIACRRKKIRCSGEKPACKHCLRSRIPCVYKVTTRKAAPRTDYMAMLDKRLRRMEDRIIKIVPKQEQDGMASSIPRASVKPSLPGTVPSTKGSSKKRGAEEAFGGPDLDSWAKAPVRTNIDSPTQTSAAFMLDASEESKFLQEGEAALPPKEIQEHLADVFFDHVYGQAYHILHKPSYMRKLRAGELPPVLVLSVCAMAARHSTHPDFSSSHLPAYYRGEEYARVARDIVLQRHDHPSITVLICLLILGLHDFAICHGRSSWSFGGQAIRMAFALQLHKDLEHDPMRPDVKLSFVDREIRRRTMWACFAMDRFNSSGTDKPTFIKEETLRIPLPVKEKNFMLDMPATTENLHGEVPGAITTDGSEKTTARDNMGVGAYLVKAISLWGRIMRYLNQGGRDMDEKKAWEEDSVYTALVREAETMPESLPESLKYSPDNLHVHDTESMANQFLFLHIVMHQNILYLNRFASEAIVPSSNTDAAEDEPPTHFITKAGARAFSAANRVSEVLKDSEPYNLTAPFAGYCAYLSGTVHVFGLFSGSPTIEKPAKQNLATNIMFLNKLKRYWVAFEFFQNHLRRLYRETADASKSGKPRTELPIMLQYSDWFEHFPVGVPSDLADPTTFKKKEKGEDAVLEQKTPLGTVEDLFASFSPQNKDASGRSNSMSGKRKALAAKRGSVASRGSDHHNNVHLERLSTDLTPEHMARLQQQGAYPGGVTLSGQTSGATSYAALNAVQHPGGYNTTLSPISPVAMGHAQFGAHQHNPHGGMYPQDVMTLQQLAHNSMLPQTMMGSFAAGHLDAATAAMIDGLPTGWTGNENGARDSSRGTASGTAGADGPHNNPHHTVYGHSHNHSANWFMAFPNMDQSEVGDVGLANGLDGFGSMFGSAADGGSMGGTGAH